MDEKKHNYYGNMELTSLSYLEFGSIDLEKSEKKIWGYWQDQTAYDFYMFSRYAKDLFLFRSFLEEARQDVQTLGEYIKQSAHVKLLDYIFKYAGIVSALKSGSYGEIPSACAGRGVCESGSSLYGLIDEAIALDAVFHQLENLDRIKNAFYIASDISDMMNQGAKAFHSDVEIMVSAAPTISALVTDISKNMNRTLALFYGLSVSVRYAVRESRDLVDIAKISGLSIYNRLSLSLHDTYSMVYGTGKAVYIISLEDLIGELRTAGYHAKYCTANMQFDKDGKGSVRASVAIAKDPCLIDEFITEYEQCIDKCQGKIDKGEWKLLEKLLSQGNA